MTKRSVGYREEGVQKEVQRQLRRQRQWRG